MSLGILNRSVRRFSGMPIYGKFSAMRNAFGSTLHASVGLQYERHAQRWYVAKKKRMTFEEVTDRQTLHLCEQRELPAA